MSRPKSKDYHWPGGKKFAFTICDDTDGGTVQNLAPVYQALSDAGIRTTKTVWSFPCPPGDRFIGQSLVDEEYRDWILSLAAKRFEIGWHGARSGGTLREGTLAGLDFFKQILGKWPETYANHANNTENIYWGSQRFDSALWRRLFLLAQGGSRQFEGSNLASKHYWADVCSERILYVRDFTFDEIVTSDVDPWMPYWDKSRPLVRSWFSSSDAANVDNFVRLLTPSNLNKLERSGGACILYVHFASGFVTNQRVRPQVLKALDDLRQRDGWYAPVAEVLKHIEKRRGIHQIKRRERLKLERRWAFEHFPHAFSALRQRAMRIVFRTGDRTIV